MQRAVASAKVAPSAWLPEKVLAVKVGPSAWREATQRRPPAGPSCCKEAGLLALVAMYLSSVARVELGRGIFLWRHHRAGRAAVGRSPENFFASSVALEITSLMSSRNRAMSFSSPNSTSVCRVRSCASSTIMTE